MLLEASILVYPDMVCRMARRLGLVPFKSELLTKRRFQVDKSGGIYIYFQIVRLINLGTLLILGYLLFPVLSLTKAGILPYPVIVGHVGIILTLGLMVYADSFVWACADEGCNQLNSLLTFIDFVNGFEDKLTATEKNDDLNFNKRMKSILHLLSVSSGTMFLIFCCITVPIGYAWEAFLVVQHGLLPFSEFAYWLLGTEFGLAMTLLMQASGMIVAYVNYWYQGTCMFCRLIGTLYGIFIIGGYALYVLKMKLCCPRYRGRLTWNSYPEKLWHPKNGYKLYKVVYLDFQGWKALTSQLIGGCIVVDVAVSSLALYLAAGYRGPIRDRVMAGCAYAFALLATDAIRFLGECHQASVILINRWKYEYIGSSKSKSRRWEVQRRQINAVQPLKFYAGSLSLVDAKMPIRLIASALDKAVTMLCGFPLHNRNTV